MAPIKKENDNVLDDPLVHCWEQDFHAAQQASANPSDSHIIEPGTHDEIADILDTISQNSDIH